MPPPSPRHVFTLSMDEFGAFWLAIPSPQGGEPTWSQLPTGYSEAQGVRIENCLRAIVNARIASTLREPKIGAAGAPTSWETERWFKLHGKPGASGKRAQERAEVEAIVELINDIMLSPDDLTKL